MPSSAKTNVLITMGIRLSVAVLATVNVAIVAQVLGKSGVGLFALLRAISAVLMLLTTFGVPNAAPYFINNRNVSPQFVLSNAMFAGIAISVVDITIWIVLSPLLSKHLLCGLGLHWVLMAAFIVPLEIFAAIMIGTLQALRKYRYSNLLQIVPEIGILTSLCIVFLLGCSKVFILVPCLLFAHMLNLFVGIVMAFAFNLRLAPRFDKRLLYETMHFGIRGQIGGTLDFLNHRINLLLVGAFTDPNTAGVYAIAARAAEIFRLVPSAVSFVLIPKIARYSLQKARQTVKQLFFPIFGANFVIMFFGYFVGPIIIPLIFDRWSLESILPFHILLVGSTAMGASGLFSAFNNGQGKPEITTYSVGITFLTTLLLDILLIPRFGIIGAAIASMCAFTVCASSLVLFFIFFNKESIKQGSELI